MTALATKKTAGVLGDDLALNAQQLMGITAKRELPVVWAVAKGSAKNKLILVPTALAISYFLPQAVQPLLMIGGVYLCYEGVEKLAHKLLHAKHEDDLHHDELIKAVADPAIDIVALEKEKIEGAVRTDFILSAEIITLSLATVSKASFGLQVAVLTLVAILMTVGVYGLVAAIVKLDDIGLHFSLQSGKSSSRNVQRWIGRVILVTAPYLLRTLSVAGTIAMFVVGGGIITHGIPFLHHHIHDLSEHLSHLPVFGTILHYLVGPVLDGFVGVIAGAIALLVVTIAGKAYRRSRS
jgi:predicted DNA repair protein MutK